jgi:adenine deaminase
MQFINSFKVLGQIVDIANQTIYPAEVTVKNQKIAHIQKIDADEALPFIVPGFIDAHVHVESSMLVPSEFARLAVVHGTVATISDPHEIANVCGLEGVYYMIENGKQVPFKFYFGAPSCVPATPFETAGAEVNAQEIDELMAHDEIVYLAEMMNWPGAVQKDPAVMEKIRIAQKYGKPVDGHAPGLRGEVARQYIAAGISTDHECFTYEEALDKIQLGMKIIIREGSAAKNFEALIDLIDDYSDQLMFCSDDKHPDNLVRGHINELVIRAVAKGKNVFDVLKVACINPIKHYKLNVGALQVGDPADFIRVEDLKHFKVLDTYINGIQVASLGKTNIPRVENKIINNFNIGTKRPEDFMILAKTNEAKVIQALDGQLITPAAKAKIKTINGYAVSDPATDILKIAVVNRYNEEPPSIAFIENFGLKEGAIASSVAHDSHNIIAVGVDDDSLTEAVNLIIKNKGGVAAVNKHRKMILALPVGGIMSNEDGYEIAKSYTEIDRVSKEMGSTLNSPFMTLSFMALLVIPDLKLSDKGLFDGKRFHFTELFE